MRPSHLHFRERSNAFLDRAQFFLFSFLFFSLFFFSFVGPVISGDDDEDNDGDNGAITIVDVALAFVSDESVEASLQPVGVAPTRWRTRSIRFMTV